MFEIKVAWPTVVVGGWVGGSIRRLSHVRRKDKDEDRDEDKNEDKNDHRRTFLLSNESEKRSLFGVEAILLELGIREADKTVVLVEVGGRGLGIECRRSAV
jgi:hypothetical protein